MNFKSTKFEISAQLKKHLSEGNHKLVTRRDFLSHGLIAFSAATAMPSVLLWGLKQARAADCGGDVGSSMVPFMAFDMAGGAALPANFLVGLKGGPEDLLTKYDLLGWNPKEGGALNTDFGIPMSAKYSKLLEGILTNASPEARANLRMGSFCHFAQDDTSGNRMNAATLALRAGFRGAYVSNGISMIDSLSGGNSAPVVASAAYKPTFVRSVNDVLGATNFGGQPFKGFKVPKMKAMADSGITLSREQAEDFLDQTDGDVLKELSKCGYEKSLVFLNNVAGLDPRLDTEAQAVYGINANTDPGTLPAVIASLTMNTLKAQAGPSVWTLGGCDYHDGTQTTGDGKDREMGIQIGRAVELAHRLKKPFFFQLLTDGGTDAQVGTRKWRGDSGDKCMTVIGYYNPKGAPKMIRKQVGYYTNGQGAERNTLIGGEPSLVGYAVLANYLNVQGRLNEFAALAPGVFTGAGQLDSVLIFEGGA
ncbi:MAG: hypothetical protein AB7P04_05550 [Bacteriovoracia bacterium]